MNKIDFVIIWVDGNDPEWQKEKKKYQPENNQDDSDIRYKDWNNLQYWFRGVERFAPWVNRIHFVTWGHVPNWLNVDNPKLNIVKHEDFIPGEYLPTFSSHTIELNLHRINGLSEQFVYFNDDMFVIKDVKPKIFFADGVCKDRLVLSAITPNDEPISSIMFNNVKAINRHFSKKNLLKKHFSKLVFPGCGVQSIKTIATLPFRYFTGFYNDHIPYAYTKRLYNEVWENEYALLDSTCQNKFRSDRDVNQWIFRYWRLAKGEFKKCSSRQGKMFSISDKNDSLFEAIEKQKFYMICCNDAGEYSDFNEQSERLKTCFKTILPDKCSFEI